VITAVDTSVLIDVFGPETEQTVASGESLRGALTEGVLIACEVVWAEVAAGFPQGDVGAAMERLGVGFSPATQETAVLAGMLWGRHRARGGARGRLVADFMIGAHASRQADRLLTRDRGFYRTYLSDLVVVDPATAR
jgi:predicted nucleic acid-binding protein